MSNLIEALENLRTTIPEPPKPKPAIVVNPKALYFTFARDVAKPYYKYLSENKLNPHPLWKRTFNTGAAFAGVMADKPANLTYLSDTYIEGAINDLNEHFNKAQNPTGAVTFNSKHYSSVAKSIIKDLNLNPTKD